MNEKYFKILIKLAQKAASEDEVPVSAIVVKNGKIISKAYNKRNKSKCILGHAEIIAIKKANKKIKDWRLNDCDLYVTLKPCSMCNEVIFQSRIANVYYIIDKPENKKEYKRTYVRKLKNDNQSDLYINILSSFFQKKRDKNK